LGPADFLNVGTLEFTAPFVLSIPNGSVVGVRGDVVTADGTIFTNVSPEIPRRSNHHFLLDGGNLPKPRRVPGTVAVLNCGPYRNYFHFLFDAMSRLRLFRQAAISADYYCVAQHTPFQRELTTLFGIREDQIIPLEKGTHVVAEQLIASSLPGLHQISEQVHLKDIATYRFVRETILAQVDQDATQPVPNLYVQRTATRTLANEDELLAHLQRQEDWEVVRLEEHSVLEQAAMFYHARQIVSVHGAGLTNLVFAQPNARVVEIFPPDLLEPIYFQMTTLFNLHYEPVIALPANESARSAGALRVDLNAVVQGLKSSSKPKESG
jgi:capsular polysaccharide biosynthesis protein